MAFTPLHNITGSTGVHVELLAPGDNASEISSIALSNIQTVDDATVSLSIAKLSSSSGLNASETYYILYNITIPAKTTLLLDDASMLAFDNSVSGYSLFITVGSGDTVDVKIKTKGK